MYNMLFGINQNYKVLLKVLNLTTEKCGRFRDCYLQDGKIIVYTRNGGGNREDYQKYIDELAKHPNYIKDYDDDFDRTYCYIEFSIPDEFKKDIENIQSEKYTPTEKFQMLIKNLQAETQTTEQSS